MPHSHEFVTKHGVRIPSTVWMRIENGIPADYTEEEFRAYSAVVVACEQEFAREVGDDLWAWLRGSAPLTPRARSGQRPR